MKTEKKLWLITFLVSAVTCLCLAHGDITSHAAYSRASRSISEKDPLPTPVFDVQRFGAVGDGKKLDTPAINKTIDEIGRASCRERV